MFPKISSISQNAEEIDINLRDFPRNLLTFPYKLIENSKEIIFTLFFEIMAIEAFTIRSLFVYIRLFNKFVVAF